jgi:uncharacterized membrane protein YjjP (DUF1212 family)
MTSPRTSQRNRHACARTIVTLQQHDGGYALLWKHYDNKNMAATLYCCCCRCILHLQQYSRRLNLFVFFFILFIVLTINHILLTNAHITITNSTCVLILPHALASSGDLRYREVQAPIHQYQNQVKVLVPAFPLCLRFPEVRV